MTPVMLPALSLLALVAAAGDPPPTVLRLDLALPEGTSSAGFRVAATYDEGAHAAAAGARYLWPRAELRPQERGFSAEIERPYPMRDDARWRVHVLSEDGLWWGSAVSRAEEREAGAPIALELSRCGRVEFNSTDDTDHVQPRGGDSQIGGSTDVIVLLHSLERPRERPIRCVSLLYNGGWIEHVPPGRYRALVHSQRLGSQERELEVRAGEVSRLQFVLAPLELGTIAGRLTSRTGAGWIGSPRLTLRGVEPPHRRFQLDGGQDCTVYDGLIRLDEEERDASFELAGVPLGEYVVEAEAGLGICWPVRTIVQPDGPPLTFTLLDDASERGFRLWAVDARTDETLAHAWILADGDDPLFPLPPFAEAGELLAPAALHGASFDFVLCAADHRPRHAGQDDFFETETGWSAVIALEPGWGRCLDVRDTAGAPVAGVEVRAGDALLATTDARGHADLAADEAPEALRLLHPEWTLAGGDLEPGTGLLTARPAWRYEARVVRVEPSAGGR